MKKVLLIALALFVATSVHFFWEMTIDTDAASNLWVGCVVAPDASGNWSIIGGGHQNIGCGTLTQEASRLKITHTKFTKVVTSSIDTDEAMSNNGYASGASVGYSYSYIYISDGSGSYVNPSNVTAGNIFVMIWGRS